MEHHVEYLRTDNEDPAVPPAFHARCSCGWAAVTHEEAEVRQLGGEHERSGAVVPAPASPTPD